jgi:methylenetetrahydrofolate dehydrogenase (NADP+) / methenyltetrahydrofolate cyclohydrolase
MAASIINGNELANTILFNLEEKISRSGRQPGLAVVLVGDDPASKIYVQNKQLACGRIGIQSKLYELEKTVSETELLSLVQQLNDDDSVHGILVQLPLPDQIDVGKVIKTISPQKDVDGFHPDTMKKFIANQSTLIPCTAHAIMQLLKSTRVKLNNKTAVVVGQSIIVGKPTAIALELAGCRVVRCDKSTADLENEVKKADILVVAAGKPHLIKGEWIKPGAVVIDVGINRLANNQVVGDVEFEVAKDYAAFITPVPGGVGPMTVAALMQNTVAAAGI